MWYNNNIFVGTAALTVIACCTILFVSDQSKDIVIPIVTGISGFISGYVSKSVKDGVTTISQTTTEETTNVKNNDQE